MKLLDTIKRYMRSKGIVARSPIKQKKPFAKPGACKFIESYDLEVELNRKAEEKAKLNELPHKIPDYNNESIDL